MQPPVCHNWRRRITHSQWRRGTGSHWHWSFGRYRCSSGEGSRLHRSRDCEFFYLSCHATFWRVTNHQDFAFAMRRRLRNLAGKRAWIWTTQPWYNHKCTLRTLILLSWMTKMYAHFYNFLAFLVALYHSSLSDLYGMHVMYHSSISSDTFVRIGNTQ